MEMLSLLGGGYFGMMYYASLIATILMSAIYLLPLIQALVAYEKKNWLEKQFSKNPASNDAEKQFRNNLLVASEPNQSYPLYKMLKFYLATTGIITAVIGFLMIVIPDGMGVEARKALSFLPLLIGVAMYFVYEKFLKGQGLWREITAVFMLGGLAATFSSAYSAYDLYEWLRSDILIYLILSGGLFVIYLMKSTLASYLYMIIIIYSLPFLASRIEYNWLQFLTHFIWFFAIAILYFWIPKLKAAKSIETKEILFGLLFMVMLISMAISQTSGLYVPALAVVLPGLYVFSKAYYSKGDWFISKPIESIVILMVIATAIGLSVSEFVDFTKNQISLFEGYSFHKQIAYLIILGLAFGAYKIYDEEIPSEEKDTLNPLILALPILAFVLTYILGSYGTQFIMTLFVLYLGYYYVSKGIEKKDSIRVIVGVNVFLVAFVVRLFATLKDQLDGRFIIGFVLLLIGALLVGVVLYLKKEWAVTSIDEEIQNVNLPGDNDIIDNTANAELS